MIRPNIPFERFLEIFAPGFVFLFGVWYLNRPFLMKYFPNIAADPTLGAAGQLSGEMRVLVFVIASLCIGVLLNHSSDVPIIALTLEPKESERKRIWPRQIIRVLFRIFTLKLSQDPRVIAVRRYTNSPRKEMFFKMLRAWTNSDETAIKDDQEAIYVHQHLCLRIQNLSDTSKGLFESKYSQITFAASMFLAVSALFPLSILALATTHSVKTFIPIHPLHISLMFVGIIYVAGLTLCINLRRRYCHFCLHIVSTALHCYEVRKDTVSR